MEENDGKRIRKTLRAGNGFASQSSKWLHFGLGPNPRGIKEIIVQWPSAQTTESFSIEGTRGRFILAQGDGVAKEVLSQKAPSRLLASTPKLPVATGVARVKAATPVFAPTMTFTSPINREPFTIGKGKPVLLNFWTSGCPACKDELKELAEQAKRLEDANLGVVALCVDGVGDLEGDQNQVQEILRQLKFPHAAGMAPPQLVKAFQAYHDGMITTRISMPVPISFLIDGEGKIKVMYKGRLAIDQLLDDVATPWGNRQQRWITSAQISGSSISHSLVLEKFNDLAAEKLMRHAHFSIRGKKFGQARSYLKEVIRLKPGWEKAMKLLNSL